MNKIVSNFYLIRLDGEPVYVGYTNRPIKQRFSEHKHDKDFGDVEPSLESLGKLEYDFTWDEDLINSYAKEVSSRETELILAYNTQDSVWQKGASGNPGGQTWNDVKYFVKTNRDNPKFREMDEEAVLIYLETSDKISKYVSHFISHMSDPSARYMGDFINHMNDPIAVYIGNFINHMNDPIARYMGDFVNGMKDCVDVYMKSFTNIMNDPVSIYMSNFVNNMDYSVSIYMKSFVYSMNDPVAIYMKSFVSNMKNLLTTSQT